MYPLDVLGYYPPVGDNGINRYCRVEGDGNMSVDTDDTKVACSKITIKGEIGIRGLVKAAISYVRERCTNEYNAEPGKPATAGDNGAATAGYRGAATAGDYGAATAGNYGAATSRGKALSGLNGLSVVRGNNVKVRGGMGAILVIAEEDKETYDVVDWKAVVVDGKKVKADTWYMLVDGELKEVD